MIDKTKIAIEIFNDNAKVYQDKFMDVGLYHDTFDVFCEHIVTENANVLEVACGPGNITKYLLEQRPDFNILCTDLAPNMIELAKANNPTAKFELMDCRDISKLDKLYHAIMCGFCFPYLDKEEVLQFISDASKILTSNGVIYISTMEDGYSNSGLKTSAAGNQMYMYYHEAGYLTQALNENGFSVIDIRRKNYPGQDGSITTDLVMIAKKEM